MLGFFYSQSEYSLLDNTIFLEDLVKKSKEYGYNFVALADNSMYGTFKFFKLCYENDIKPVIGLKAFIESDIDLKTEILLYAKNNEGYKNLLKISTIINTSKDGFITFSELAPLKKNIIAISSGENNIINKYIMLGQYSEALNQARLYKNYFEDFYLGLQLQNISGEESANYLMDISSKEGIVLLPISKTSYLNKEDYLIYEYLKKIDNKKAPIGNFYLKKKEELIKEFENYPFVFANLDEVINNIDVRITKVKNSFPKFSTPDNISSNEYLKNLAYLGLKKRLNNDFKKLSIYQKRLNYELSVIDKMGFSDFFLIVYDFVKYAKKKGYNVGPGRGSAAGSLVSYCVGITNVDPIKYNLLFERFLNPERITMPDIDVDFPDDKREDVIKYVGEKYGNMHVCHISTFGRYQARMSIRDVARVMEMPNYRVDEVLKYIDSSLSIKENWKNESLILLSGDEQINNLLTIASKIEGLPKHTSTHAAGLILSSDPLTENVALDNGLNGLYQSQLEATDLEALGLLKIDFLGLKNLTIIRNVCDLIKDIDINKIPLDDSLTYELLSNAQTNGVFQLESEGIKKVLLKLKPSNIEDVIAVLALYRPGPMDQIDDYIRRKNGESFQYLHDDLKPILESTYGIIVYQEQIMQIASVFAGYSLGEADILRRAVSKKKHDVLENERLRFVNGALKKGYKESVGNLIYDYIVKFANYGFNRNHSVPYAIISYQMAYLKARYKKEFMSVLLTGVIGSQKQTEIYINECLSSNIKVYPPNINYSTNEYKVNRGILFPLSVIKNIGIQTSKKIIDERENGLFTSFYDFKRRVDLPESIYEILIYSGAFDCFKITKKEMIENISVNQSDITKYMDGIIKPDYQEYPLLQLMSFEKEAIGFNLNYTILTIYKDFMRINKILSIGEAVKLKANTNARVIGVIKNIKEINTKSKEQMAFLTISDGCTDNECVLFPKFYKNLKNLLYYDIICVFEISTQTRDGKIQFEILNIKGV